MAVKEIGSIGVKLEGTMVSSFFDKDFVERIERGMKNATFSHFCLIFKKPEKGKDGAEDYELVHMAHDSVEDAAKKVISVKSDDPAALRDFLSIVKGFLEH